MPIRQLAGPVRTFESVEDFLDVEEIPHGTFSIIYGGVPIDFQYEDRGYETTAIFFQAAVSAKVQKLPVFLGKSFSTDPKINRLFVSDPTLYLNERIRLGWYAGSSTQPMLQDVLADVFLKISGNRRTIYFGASGGGFAALAFSALHSGTLAIAVNPQTSIADYTALAVARWTDLAWGYDNEATGRLEIPNTLSNLRPLYSTKLDNYVLYVQNTGDTTHVNDHWEPFFATLNPSNHVTPIIAFSGEGHVTPPADYLTALLHLAADTESWQDLDPALITVSPVRT